MELRNVRSLLQVAETGSLTRAAADLDLTPAAVHKQLRVLEKDLGLKLYQKRDGALRLTQHGTRLLPDLRRLLDAERAMREHAEESKQTRAEVRIGDGASLSATLLPPLLRRFHRQHPATDIYVEAANTQALLTSLRRGGLDAALIADVDDELIVEARWKYEFVFMAPRRIAPRRRSLLDLEEEPFILSGAGYRLVEEYFASLGLRIRAAMRFDHADAGLAMAEAGVGIAVMPYWSAPRGHQRSTWVLDLKEGRLYGQVVLVRMRSAQMSRAAQSFVEMVKGSGFPEGRMMRS
jgi:DNA-binding transcriptional LysR family regulator